MKIGRFEEIVAWQKAKQLSILIYRTFRSSRDYAFRDQIQRASVSVMNNIAEGFERHTNNEFRQFLYISTGSCGEVRSMLHLANELEIINNTQYIELSTLSEEISRILGGLIKSL